MLDLSHIPNSQQNIQIFYAIGGTIPFQTWNKPRKCSYVYIMCIGGAGGGAGGFNSISSVYAPGGAGAGISRALYNAQQLPDRLYVQVGLGGAGGGAGTAGQSGTRSWVSLQSVSPAVAQNMVLGSGAAAAGGGRVDGGNSGGETAIVQTSSTFLTLSNFIGTAGNTSVGSVSVGTPPNITPFTSQITSQGAGGGGGPSVNGGSILATSISPLIEGGAFTTVNSAIGGRGANGITSFKPFYSLGGAGGGNSSGTSGIGGNGGNGGIGCGGGGGGNGTTGGTGGRGGDGLVIIISF